MVFSKYPLFEYLDPLGKGVIWDPGWVVKIYQGFM